MATDDFNTLDSFLGEAEQEERWRRESEAIAQEQLKKAMDLALTWFPPFTEADFRRKESNRVARMLEPFRDLLTSRGGYSLSAKAMEKYLQGEAAMVSAIREGDIEFSAQIHMQKKIELAREAFDREVLIFREPDEREEQFQRFLAELGIQVSEAATA